MKTKPDAQAADDFANFLLAKLPPVIARADVGRQLGGLITPKTLANADGAGTGPKIVYRWGKKKVVYRTDSLVEWLVGQGIHRLVGLDSLGGRR